MLNIHLKVIAVKYEIYRDVYNLSARDRINSIWIYENDFIMDRILNDLTMAEVWRFLLNMFNIYSWEFTRVESSEFFNGSVIHSFYFRSKPIPVSVHNIAISLPAKVRKKYFIMDTLEQKYKVNPDLYLNEDHGEAE